jgi:hypothetical protein
VTPAKSLTNISPEDAHNIQVRILRWKVIRRWLRLIGYLHSATNEWDVARHNTQKYIGFILFLLYDVESDKFKQYGI